MNKSSKTDIECEISINLELIKLTLSEIMPKRQKREINEIGTLWKWSWSRWFHNGFEQNRQFNWKQQAMHNKYKII